MPDGTALDRCRMMEASRASALKAHKQLPMLPLPCAHHAKHAIIDLEQQPGPRSLINQ